MQKGHPQWLAYSDLTKSYRSAVSSFTPGSSIVCMPVHLYTPPLHTHRWRANRTAGRRIAPSATCPPFRTLSWPSSPVSPRLQALPHPTSAHRLPRARRGLFLPANRGEGSHGPANGGLDEPNPAPHWYFIRETGCEAIRLSRPFAAKVIPQCTQAQSGTRRRSERV